MNSDINQNIDLNNGIDNFDDFYKAKLIEVINDIKIKDRTKQNIIVACTERAAVIGENKRKTVRIFGMSLRAKQASCAVVAAVICIGLIGYNVWWADWTALVTSSIEASSESHYTSGNASDESQEQSEYSANTSQEVSSIDSTPIVLSVPKWFAPGELIANKYYQNFQDGTKFRQTLSSQYIYINSSKDAIFKTEEHKNCTNFRFNVETGQIECIDHFIR